MSSTRSGTLERLAVELTTQNTCPKNRAALTLRLETMREAVANQDRNRHVAADVETHWLIWRQAKNEHLFRMLSSMIGPIFMFVANNADAFDWNETFALHEALVNSINAGDVVASLKSLDLHMDNALP